MGRVAYSNLRAFFCCNWCSSNGCAFAFLYKINLFCIEQEKQGCDKVLTACLTKAHQAKVVK